MKRYVVVTGTIFGLLALAHVWRAIEEGLARAFSLLRSSGAR